MYSETDEIGTTCDFAGSVRKYFLQTQMVTTFQNGRTKQNIFTHSEELFYRTPFLQIIQLRLLIL